MSNATLSTQLISTSALAKKLDLPAKTLFELLQNKSWIERIDNQWKLTGKGQFEGGDYVHSKKYGEYIGWPETVLEHQIFIELFNLPLRTRIIGREINISAHRLNALLAEIGWQQRHHRGWILTRAGKEHGGREHEDDESGIPYTCWPRSVLEQPLLAEQLKAINPTNVELTRDPAEARNAQRTLEFETTEIAAEQDSYWQAIDGHKLTHIEDLLVDNWLYLMNVTHAYRRTLPDPSLGHCDFYLPSAHVYVECWHEKSTASSLSRKLERLDYYQTNELAFFEINSDELQNLDAVLPKRLLRHGITVY